jgi:hypothetical protein
MKLLTVVVACLLAQSTSAGSPVVSDASGSVLGFYLGPNNISTSVTVVTTTGFIVQYETETGVMLSTPVDAWGEQGSNVSNLYFTTPDCTGQAYITSSGVYRGGSVARQIGGQIYYVQKGATALALDDQSRMTGGVCQTGSNTSSDLMPVFPNDPNVTGVSNTPPATGRLRIEVADMRGANSFRVFRDGFEGNAMRVGDASQSLLA